MSELKAMKFFEAVPTSKEGFYQPGAFVDGYLKSEADKVIAEKDKKIDLYKRGWEESDRINEHLYAQLRHHKYKRCLGIAAVCFEKSYSTTLVKYDKELGYRLNFYDWWGKRWLELAKKFKEGIQNGMR